jgi:hypothetical protein
VEISGTGNLGSGNNGELELGGNDAYTCTYDYDDVQINSQGYPGPVPTGTVQFAVDGSNLDGPVTLSDGMATSPTVSIFTAGTHTITASYSGDSSYTASSGTFTQTINPSPDLVNYVDFETGDFSQCASHVGGAIVTSPALDGTYSLQLQRSNSVANVEIRQSGDYYNLSTVYYAFLFEYAANPGEGGMVNFQDTSSGYKAAIHLSPSYQLEFYDQTGTLLAIGSTILQPYQVYTISAMIGTGSNAAWQVLINGTIELSGTGNLGSTNNGSIKLGGDNLYTTNYYYDDVAIDSQGYPTVGGGGGARGGPSAAAVLVRPVQAQNSDPVAARIAFSSAPLTTGSEDQPAQVTSQPLALATPPVSTDRVGRSLQPPMAVVDALFANWDKSPTDELTAPTSVTPSTPPAAALLTETN